MSQKSCTSFFNFSETPAKHWDLFPHSRIAKKYGEGDVQPGKAEKKFHPQSGFEPMNY